MAPVSPQQLLALVVVVAVASSQPSLRQLLAAGFDCHQEQPGDCVKNAGVLVGDDPLESGPLPEERG